MPEFDRKNACPLRSTLFSLEPLGIGTPSVESLESYTCRLANRHGVPRRKLEQLVNLHGERLYDDRSGPPRLDSPTEPAWRFATRLAELTKQPFVAALGLGRFANKLSTMNTLRRYRAWCGDCFCDAREASVPPHLPLVWSLSEYQRCHVHEQVLETQCQTCMKRSEASNSWSRDIDHCPLCNKDLARRRQGGTPSFAHLARRHDEPLDMFLSEVLGDFVAQASTTTLPAGDADIGRVIRSAVERGVAKFPAQIARTAGLSKTTLHTVANGTNSPSLAVILRLAAAADVSLAGIFYSEFWMVGAHGSAPPALSRASRLRINQQHDWDQIRRETSIALARGEALSLRGVARQLGIEQAYFASRLGDVRIAIRQRGVATRAAQRQEILKELTALVRQTRAELVSQGVRPTARAIGKVLGRPVGSPYMKRALSAAKA